MAVTAVRSSGAPRAGPPGQESIPRAGPTPLLQSVGCGAAAPVRSQGLCCHSNRATVQHPAWSSLDVTLGHGDSSCQGRNGAWAWRPLPVCPLKPVQSESFWSGKPEPAGGAGLGLSKSAALGGLEPMAPAEGTSEFQLTPLSLLRVASDVTTGDSKAGLSAPQVACHVHFAGDQEQRAQAGAGVPILPPEDGGGAGQRQCRPAGAHGRGLVGDPGQLPSSPDLTHQPPPQEALNPRPWRASHCTPSCSETRGSI